MHIQSLDKTSTKAITEVFNKSFEDYKVPMHRTEAQMQEKIKAEYIDLSASVGAFDNETLVGFILFGVDTVDGKKTMWDGGTGVLKEYRGKSLTKQMFQVALEHAEKQNIKRILLEVLESNTTAYNIYESLGFKKVRLLHAYHGLPDTNAEVKYHVEVMKDYNPKELSALCTWQPAWQQMDNRVTGWGDAITTIAIKDNEKVVAYAHYNTETKRVFQFAVDNNHRRKGFGSALINYISDNDTELSIVNIDERSTDALAFLEAIGIKHFISQYEMELTL